MDMLSGCCIVKGFLERAKGLPSDQKEKKEGMLWKGRERKGRRGKGD